MTRIVDRSALSVSAVIIVASTNSAQLKGKVITDMNVHVLEVLLKFLGWPFPQWKDEGHANTLLVMRVSCMWKLLVLWRALTLQRNGASSSSPLASGTTSKA